MACGLMAYGLGRGKRKTKRRKIPVVRTAFLVCRTSLLRSSGSSRIALNSHLRSAFQLLLLILFFPFGCSWFVSVSCFVSRSFCCFIQKNNCVVSSWKNSPCLPGFALAKSFSGYLSAHVLFSLSPLSDSWRGPQQLCYADVLFLTVFVFVGFLLCSLLDLL